MCTPPHPPAPLIPQIDTDAPLSETFSSLELGSLGFTLDNFGLSCIVAPLRSFYTHLLIVTLVPLGLLVLGLLLVLTCRVKRNTV